MYNTSADMPLPPEELRFRVHGAIDESSFLAVGKRCTDDIENALLKQGYNLADFSRILDFGCGSGRILRWLLPNVSKAELTGTDPDKDAVDWCSKNARGANFFVGSQKPPLKRASGSFDLILAISIFTHFDIDMQKLWMAELTRLLCPNGILIASFHGTGLISGTEHPEGNLEDFHFNDDGSWARFFPDYDQFGTAFHSRRYIENSLPDKLSLLGYFEKGLNDHQDLGVFSRR